MPSASAFHGLRLDEHADVLVDDVLGASAARRHDGCSAGERLDEHHAEALRPARQDESRALLEEVHHLGERLLPDEGDGIGQPEPFRLSHEPLLLRLIRAIRAFSDDDQLHGTSARDEPARPRG